MADRLPLRGERLDIRQEGEFRLRDGTAIIVDYSQGSTPRDLIDQLDVAIKYRRPLRVSTIVKRQINSTFE